MLAKYYWPALEYRWYTQWHTIGENEFYLFQQELVLGSGWSFVSTFLSDVLCPVWTCASLVYAVTLSEFMCTNFVNFIWKNLFPWCHPLLLALTIFLWHLLWGYLNLQGRRSLSHLWWNMFQCLVLYMWTNPGSLC